MKNSYKIKMTNSRKAPRGPVLTDARAHYWAAARRLRNPALDRAATVIGIIQSWCLAKLKWPPSFPDFIFLKIFFRKCAKECVQSPTCTHNLDGP
jgi:hypothetical protein